MYISTYKHSYIHVYLHMHLYTHLQSVFVGNMALPYVGLVVIDMLKGAHVHISMYVFAEYMVRIYSDPFVTYFSCKPQPVPTESVAIWNSLYLISSNLIGFGIGCLYVYT